MQAIEEARALRMEGMVHYNTYVLPRLAAAAAPPAPAGAPAAAAASPGRARRRAAGGQPPQAAAPAQRGAAQQEQGPQQPQQQQQPQTQPQQEQQPQAPPAPQQELLPQVMASREDVQRRAGRQLAKWLRQAAVEPEVGCWGLRGCGSLRAAALSVGAVRCAR